jgi:hypothetical protein
MISTQILNVSLNFLYGKHIKNEIMQTIIKQKSSLIFTREDHWVCALNIHVRKRRQRVTVPVCLVASV